MSGPPSSRSSMPSLSGEPSQRRLGMRGNGPTDRPVRAQIVVALVAALTLVAVPLYLMRRPVSPQPATVNADAGAALKPLLTSRPVEAADAGKAPERLTLSQPQRVRCGASARRGQEGSLCDQLPDFEQALASAIRDSEKCAPRTPRAGSINYVMTVDFDRRFLHVFPGASGDFRGPQARRAAACVKRALPKPDWNSVRHQYRHYTIAILASYTPESALVPAGAGPKFDP